ncbi:MAG: hypothetical protein LC679_15975 [Intrasporangiaceae bacterium]|nr:hypothetical protein [Intrasporangiaceae bacterium]
MARRSRRDAPEPDDYVPDEDEFEEEEEERPRRKRRPRDDDEDEEEEEERPRRRKRRDEEDDEDESPRRRKRRPRDDEDDEEDEEEERPRRRKRRDEEEDEDESPRRRKRRPRDEDDDEDDEEEEDRPRRSKKGGKSSKKKGRGSNRNSGWGGYDNVKSQSSSFADKFMVTKLKGEALIKFLDDAPFDSYGLHWFDDLEGKKGWLCLESVGEDRCPGCDLGDRPSPNALFNVLALDDDGDWNLKVIAAGTRLTGQIQGLADGKGGLTGPYFSVMAGPKGSGTGNFQRVKERDLEEDWDIEPLDDDEIDEWLEDLHVLADVEQVPSYKDFKEAVRDLDE